MSIYERRLHLSDRASGFNLHEIASPLAVVIQTLANWSNREEVIIALGAPETWRISPHQLSTGDPSLIDRAYERYETLMHDLREIARNVPASPPRRGRGRPPKSGDLYAVVDILAEYWERTTGEAFKQDWERGEPLTPATEFVHAVVAFLDPPRLEALPKVTERIVTERRAAAPRK